MSQRRGKGQLLRDWRGLLADERDGLCHVTALVGAGVSVDAGLPVAYALLDDIVSSLVRRRWAAEELMRLARAPRPDMLDEHDFMRFETLLLWVSRVFDPHLDLFRFLDAFTVPGDLHRRLASATSRGLRLLTVNFDDLLERALLEQGATPRTVDVQKPETCASADLPVYKLHGMRVRHAAGTVAVDDGTLLATTEMIAATHPGAFLNGPASEMLSTLVDGRTLLVAGYSANDDLDVVPTLATSRPARVVWLDHRPSPPRRLPANLSGRSRLPWRRLLATMRDRGVDVIPVRGRTGEALEALGLLLPAGASRHTRSAARWRPAVRSWATAVGGHDPTGLGLAALLFGELGRYDLVERALAESRPSRLPDGRWTAARRTYEQGQTALLREPSDPVLAYELAEAARRQATRPSDARTAVLAELLLGRAAFLQQHYEPAASHFGRVRKATPRASAEHVYARAWLGRAQVWEGHPKLGLRHLRFATESFRARGELEGLLDALEGCGVAELALMRLSAAQDALGQANGVARALGFVDRRFTTACGMAEVELLAGRAADADRRVRAALRLASAGGQDEVADAWAVLAACSLELGRWKAAVSAAERAVATTTTMNRNRKCEHLCTLAEAHHLRGAERAGDRAMGAASMCEREERAPLGNALQAALVAARGGSAAWIRTRDLVPSGVVRLGASVRRLRLTGLAAARIVARADDLRDAALREMSPAME